MGLYRNYPKYKRTQVGYLGSIPDHWNVLALHYVATLRSGSSITALEFKEDGDYPVYGGNGFRGYFDFFTHDGDYVLIGRQGALCGNINLARGKFYASEHALVVSPTRRLKTEWMGYLLESMNLNQYSLAAAQPGLSAEVLGRLKIVFPSDNEQAAIARFLDYKTAQIDALIAKKQSLLTKLAEKRTALISHAVTKGLDPSVPMKNSGVEWLGEIPAHWIAKRTKFTVSYIGSGKTPKGGSEVYVQEGIMILRSQNVHDKGLSLEDVAFITDEADANQSISRVIEGDVLLNITGASIGRTSIVPSPFPFANVNQHVCILRPIKHLVASEYLHLLLCSRQAKDQISSLENGTSREGLNFPQVGGLLFAFPPVIEQLEVIDYLKKKMAVIDKQCEKVILVINCLKEYRSAMITDAVTGKIDVRNFNMQGSANMETVNV